MKHSVGIDQDGTDFSYFTKVRLGSSKKTLYMLTDTGAGTSWVMGSDCSSAACGLHNSFGPADSSTLDLGDDDDDAFSIGYRTGSVKGVVARDRVSVGDLAVDLGLPLIVVASPGLGTINHTMLTLEAARAAGLPCRACVCKDVLWMGSSVGADAHCQVAAAAAASFNVPVQTQAAE